MIYVNDETNLNEYQAIYNYLLENKSILEQKLEVKQNKMKWYSLYRPAKRHIKYFNEDKIIFGQFRNGEYTLDTNKILLSSNEYFIISETENLRYMIAILNSNISLFYNKMVMNSLQGNTTIAQKNIFENTPIPQIPKEQQKSFEILVNYILFAKEQDMNHIASLFESIIDGMVYDLYFEDDMKKADCFITTRVEEIVKPWSKYDNDEFKKEFAKVIYDICREDKTIQRGLIFSRNIEVVKIINGDKKDD